MIAELNQLLTQEEAAKLLRLSVDTLRKITTPNGPIPFVRVGKSKRFDPDDIRAYVTSQKSASPIKREETEVENV